MTLRFAVVVRNTTNDTIEMAPRAETDPADGADAAAGTVLETLPVPADWWTASSDDVKESPPAPHA
jgi:hypothetical protein